MATIRLIPSTYYLSNTSYLSVSNASNMYNNTDNSTYATVTNSRNSTNSYYIYLRGFNFDDIPSNAIINSFVIKFKAYESGVSTSTSYRPYLCNNTSTITGDCNVLSTSVQTLSFSNVTSDWETIKGYGDNFGIRINCKRTSQNTTGYVYIYGAEIEVDYTIPVYHNISINNNSSDVTTNINSTDVLEGNDFTIEFYGYTNETITDNNVDVTSSLSEVSATSGTLTAHPDSYTSSSLYSDSSASQAIGMGTDNTASGTNLYSSGSGTEGTLTYTFDCSSIPANATIVSVTCAVKGKLESTSNSSEKFECQLYSGNIAKGASVTFTSTTAEVVNFTDVGTWTRNELDDAKLVITIGYYGGALTGADFIVNYSTENESYYAYTITNILEDHTIVIGTSIVWYNKISDTWETVISIMKRVNNEWVQVSKTDALNYLNSLTNILYYQGTLRSISLSWASVITGETLQFTTKIDNVITTTGVTYTIVNGSQYATIDSTGLLTIDSSAYYSNVTVVASYGNLTASKNLTITYKQSTSSGTTNTYVITNEDGSETTRIETIEENDDGTTITTTNDTTTNQDGSSSQTTTTTTDNGDGSSTSSSTTTNYDENGNTTGSSSNETTNNADGSSSSLTTNYDENGDETGHESNTVDTSGNSTTQSVEKDENGNDVVTGYNIDTTNNENGGKDINGSEDTGYVPFSSTSNGFEINIHAYFNKSEQTDSSGNYTLLNLMYEVSPWPGICIRYERSQSSLLIITAGNGLSNYQYVTEPSDHIYNLRITYNKTTDIVTYYNKLTNTTIATVAVNGSWEDVDFGNLTARIGSSWNPSTNQPYRYGVCTIYEFSISNI